MISIKSSFYNKDKEILQPVEAHNNLTAKGYTVNFHLTDKNNNAVHARTLQTTGKKSAVFMVSHRNQRIQNYPVIFTYPQLDVLVKAYRIVRACPANLLNAKFYKLRDGTTIYLYYYLGEWKMASGKCVNIGDTLIQGHTFWDLFNECAPGLLDELKTTKSYSFGFTNTKIHYSLDGNRFWNNNSDEPIQGIPFLEETHKVSNSSDGDLESFGTLIIVPNSKCRYIVYGYLMNKLQLLKYDHRIMKEVQFNNYNYTKYTAIRAWLMSPEHLQTLISFSDKPEIAEIGKQADDLLNEILEDKKKSKLFSSALRPELIRNVKNIEAFYECLVNGAEL